MEKQTVKINTEYIKLDQLLKFAGIAESGSDAKDIILSEMVFCNGKLCTMRGKKLRPGDELLIKFEDADLQISIEDSTCI